MFCDYGCGKSALFILRNNKRCCSEKYQQCSVIKSKNSKGVLKMHLDGKGHKFTEEHRMRSHKSAIENKITSSFTINSTASNAYIKKTMLERYSVKNICSDCGLSEWRGCVLVLELHHINGDNKDNRIENLCLLCPNCHSLTTNYRGKNINTGSKKISDDEILEASTRCSNIRQILLELNLAASGGNYERVKRILENKKVTD
jgi:Zn finger protein HypA/HybF involved in hydrogenase expression